MKSSGLDDKTDLILLSDHGMARLSMRSIWFIDDFLEEMTTIEKIIDYGPLVMLYPYKGNEHRVENERKLLFLSIRLVN